MHTRIAAILFCMLSVISYSIGQESGAADLEKRKIEKLTVTHEDVFFERGGGGAPEQDCNSAIAVCQSTYVQPVSYSGFGNTQEVPLSSCLGQREKNSVWYIFTVQTSGTLTFTIDPNDNSDDYDFALYDLTGRNCSDIVRGIAPEVRCNYCVDPGNTGISASGQNPSEDCCSNSPGCQFSSLLNVTVGQTYVLTVSNFSSSQSGYTLTFGGTANIFDNKPPEPLSAITPCGVNYLDLQMSEAVLCNSISGNGSEFTLTGPGGPFTVTGATGVDCGSATPRLQLQFSPQVTIGSTYTITINDGSDGNTLIDNCGNEMPQGTSFQFVATPPDAEITGPSQVCAGSPVVLSVTEGTSYEWSTGETTQSITVFPEEETTYSVTVSSGTCVQNAEKTVSVKDSPIASFEYTPQEVCTGEVVEFTSTSTLLKSCLGLGFDPCTQNSECAPFPCLDNFSIIFWEFGDGDVSILDPSPSHIFDEPGTYNVSLTVNDIVGGCSNEFVVPITVTSSGGSLNLEGDNSICIGESTVISAVGGTDYSWTSVPPGFTSDEGTIEVSPEVTTTYTVTSPGCNSDLTGSITVTVNELPDVDINPSSDNICAGASTTLTASGALDYVWSPSTGLNTTTGPAVEAGPFASTTYTVTGTDANGCQSTAEAVIIVDSSLPVSITADGPLGFCAGDSVTLDAGAGFASYSWNTEEETQFITVRESGEYVVIVTDGDGCSGVDTVTVNAVDIRANAGEDREICEGESTALLATGGVEYSWSPATGLSNPNISNPLASPEVSTEYVVTVSEIGCTDRDTVFVSVIPGLEISVSNDTTILIGESVDLFASGGVTYSWSPATGLSSTDVSDPVASPQETITYTVTVTGEDGCTRTASVTVEVINPDDCNLASLFVPNAFSPNGDGRNDLLEVKLNGSYDRFDFAIFNSWGEKVFESDDIARSWDGRYEGEEQGTDVFGYYIEIECNGEIIQKKGNITLLR